MSQAKTRERLSWDEYLDWEQRQPTKHELVDGQIVAMVGSTSRNDLICNNLRRELGNQLRRKPCRVQGPDLKVRCRDNARYPDALIDRGKLDPLSLFAQEPVAIFEVLSKSTAWIDQTFKLRDYEAVPVIKAYVLISQDEPRILIYTRDRDGRLSAQDAQLIEGLSQHLNLPSLDVTVALQDLYEGLEFEAS